MGKGEEDIHVLIFPCPAQGHVNSMLKLAELLALNHLHVSFLNTEFIHDVLTRFGDIQALSACYPTLHFKTISDCYNQAHDHPGFGDGIRDIIVSITQKGKPLLREILVSENPGIPKVSCIILDGVFGSLATDLAAELRIPLIHFRTTSACSLWTYLCVPKLLECKELPIRGDEDMDRTISNMPGMENLLRCRDLPSFFRSSNERHMPLDSIVFLTQQSLEADAFMLNTFDELEGPVLSQMLHHFPKLYTVGPLHHHLNMRKLQSIKENNDVPSFKNNFFEVDRSCMAWLDAQMERSVIYVSFGSCSLVTREQLLEFWHGLVNSKKRFLWVMRTEMVPGKLNNDDWLPAELEEGTKERGFIVGWAPQEEVLVHKAVGGFLTHSGWNSTLESLVAGVPMICWPYFADQQINSRFVSEVWKIGLDMKDVCDRHVVENMVNDLMVHRRDQFLRSAQEMAMLADKSVSPGGSSYTNLDDLIQYIKSASQENN